MKTVGLLHAIVVREKPRSFAKFELICGARRLRAAKLLGWKQINATVRKAQDLGSHVASLLENLQREDLDPFDEAAIFKELMSSQSFSRDALAELLHKHRNYISTRLTLLNAHPEVESAFRSGEMAVSKCIPISRLPIQDQPHVMTDLKDARVTDVQFAVSALLTKGKQMGHRAGANWMKDEIYRRVRAIDATTEQGETVLGEILVALGGQLRDEKAETVISKALDFMRSSPDDYIRLMDIRIAVGVDRHDMRKALVRESQRRNPRVVAHPIQTNFWRAVSQ